MEVPKDIIKAGKFTVYGDTDRELVKDVQDFNEFMGQCRIRMKKCEEVKFGFAVINPLITAGLVFFGADTVFLNPVLAAILLAVSLIAYVVFSLYLRKLVVSVFATALLLILDWRFVFLLVVNIVLFSMLYLLERPIKHHISYPIFNNIKIRYERHNSPNYEQNNH